MDIVEVETVSKLPILESEAQSHEPTIELEPGQESDTESGTRPTLQVREIVLNASKLEVESETG